MADPAALQFTIEIGWNWGGDVDVDPTWTNVSAYVMEWSIRSGRRSMLDKFDAGTATITLDNRDGRFDPLNGSSPYSPNVVPDKPVRIKCGSRVRFVGFIDTYATDFAAGSFPAIRLDAVDPLVRFAERDMLDLGGVATRGAELTGVRAKAFGCHTSSDNGLTLVLAKTYTDGTVLNALQDIEESEAGYMYADPNVGNGMRPVFRSRLWRFLNPNSVTRTYAFVDVGAVGEVEADEIGATYGKADKIDRVTVHTVSAGDIIVGTGPRGIDRTILSNDTNEATSLATYLLQVFGSYDLRVDTVTWAMGTGVYTGGIGYEGEVPVINLNIGDRVRVRATTPGGVSVLRECWVEGIEVDVRSGLLDATATLRLSPADSRTYWTMDSSKLDTETRLAY